MLVDDVKITIKAGDGGNGAATFKRNAQTAKGGPDGGNGGNGGDVYFIGSDDLGALYQFRFKKHLQAENGTSGKKQNLFGKNADHLYISVPLGTSITDLGSGKTYEITDTKTPVLLARGGKGGRGNNEFKTAILQAPKFAEPGEKGEEKSLHLVLRLIADVGFIGLPNAGKSSLLAALTNAQPKIGNYPFTTLEPNIGMMDRIALADIPGLIEGASTGKGLGIKFLKHIVKTKLLVHCIEVTDPDPVKTYQTVRDEFETYNKVLLEKPEIIAITKIDLADQEQINRQKTKLESFGRPILPVSVFDDASLSALKQALQTHLNPSSV